MILTNTSKIEFLKYLIPRIVFQIISFIKDFITGNFSHAFAQFKAGLWIFFHPRFIFNKRKFVKTISPKYNSDYFYPQSIVFDYFLFYKRKFRDLIIK